MLRILALQVCYSRCNMCATTGPHEHYAEAEQLLVASQQALASSEECVTVEGRFQAIMAVLMPCRSDRSAQVNLYVASEQIVKVHLPDARQPRDGVAQASPALKRAWHR